MRCSTSYPYDTELRRGRPEDRIETFDAIPVEQTNRRSAVFELNDAPSLTGRELYDHLAVQVGALLEGESDPIANAANLSALLFHSLPDINWAGFYFLRNDELVLGPFQGRPACVRIRIGRGVCGTAVARRETMLVPNVDEFPGHIACDSASRSEIVVPLVVGGEVLGVLDVDSPSLGRFDSTDRVGLERLVAIYLNATYYST